jgi:hypothetical protein
MILSALLYQTLNLSLIISLIIRLTLTNILERILRAQTDYNLLRELERTKANTKHTRNTHTNPPLKFYRNKATYLTATGTESPRGLEPLFRSPIKQNLGAFSPYRTTP